MPCCAMEKCREEFVQHNDDHDNDDACSNCSPFFNCDGCATATISSQFTQFEIVSFRMTPVYNLCTVNVSPGTSPDYWQPPKLG